MTTDPPKTGRTAWDFASDLVQRERGLVIFIVCCLFGVAILSWYLSHANAAPGSKVSFFGITYEKAKLAETTPLPQPLPQAKVEDQKPLICPDVKSNCGNLSTELEGARRKNEELEKRNTALRQEVSDKTNQLQNFKNTPIVQSCEIDPKIHRAMLADFDACKKRVDSPATVPSAPAIFVWGLGLFIGDCRTQVIAALSQMSSASGSKKNVLEGTVLYLDSYTIFGLCSSPGPLLVGAGPNFREAERLVRQVVSYLGQK